VPPDDDDPLRQYLYKSTVVMMQSYFEEYVRCIISVGTFWKAPEVRKHLASHSPDPERYAIMPSTQVAREAQAHVQFERGAAKLKALFAVVTGGSPYADSQAEEQWQDLVVVRNIIVHAGGWPTAGHVETIKSPNAVISSNDIGGTRFYHLRLSGQFFADTVNGITRSLQATEARLAVDPVFAIE
jgi:hypothetical protein